MRRRESGATYANRRITRQGGAILPRFLKYTRFSANLPDQTKVLFNPYSKGMFYENHIYKKILSYESDMGNFHVRGNIVSDILADHRKPYNVIFLRSSLFTWECQ